MSEASPTKCMLSVAIIVMTVACGVETWAQMVPYRLVPKWAELPPGMKWGGAGGICLDAKGNVWASHRGDPNIIQFDPSGKFLKGFAKEMFLFPHGCTIDQDGNLWVADAVGPERERNPAMKGRNAGYQVFKFSPDGKVLMTLGKAGVQGPGEDTFIAPVGVAINAKGDIFIADGHGAREGPLVGDRIVKYSKDGKFIKSFGKQGTKPGEFWGPHGIAIDSQGRLFVADRNNNRVQVLDQDGNVLEVWRHFGRPSDIYITRDDIIYVADSQSTGADIQFGPRGPSASSNPGWLQGIWIGDVRSASVLAFVPGITSEAVAADDHGNLYVGPSGESLQKYVRRW